ncbi:MAG: AEC family transporter, partial [Traorella sp.]
MVDILIRLQGTILIYLFMGFLLRKTKMIDENNSQFLSKLVLEFILPINIFYSCLTSFTLDTLKECFILLFLAIAIEGMIYFV